MPAAVCGIGNEESRVGDGSWEGFSANLRMTQQYQMLPGEGSVPFSCVRLCGTPETAAHQALPSLGFSRQEHWSGLPFPSPMRESEKWKGSRSLFPGKSTGVGCHCLLQGICIVWSKSERMIWMPGETWELPREKRGKARGFRERVQVKL